MDVAGQEAKNKEHLANGIERVAKAAASNLMQAHVTLNPLIYLFHAGMTPTRVFSEYPMAALKILPDLLHDPMLLLGKTIPEAEKAGVYTKALNSHNPKDWTKEEWRRGLTGIPQTQTFNESLAYLLSKHGVPLDEALNRVALSNREPLNMPMFMTAPDRSGSVGPLSYLRYAMFQHAAYLNMYKRMLDFKDKETAIKAAGSLLLYTGINYALYGAKAAIPGYGAVSHIANLNGDGTKDQFGQTLDDFDKQHGGNQLYNLTGLDLGEHMSPLSFFDLYHGVKMIGDTAHAAGNDLNSLFKPSTNMAKMTSAAHMMLLLSEMASHKGFTTPHSLVKAVKSYGKSVDNAADNPLGVDWNEWFDNEMESNLGQRTLNRFKEH